MIAKVNTKSNYYCLNGKWLNVVEIVNTRVTCKVYNHEVGKDITVDFSLSEVVAMDSTKTVNQLTNYKK
jgi:hypothetical protein